MEDNMKIWNQVCDVPDNAQKPIAGGRLRGKTDINPMWRIAELTKIYGPCGVGWWYTIDKQWLEPYANEIAAFCNITLYTKDAPHGIPGTGGNAFVAIEKGSPYVSDECFKMALTDAISVAAKALGFGANVYWKGGESKYLTIDSAPDKPQKAVEADKKQQDKPQVNQQAEPAKKEQTAEVEVKDNPFLSQNKATDNEKEHRYFCEACTLEIKGRQATVKGKTVEYQPKEIYDLSYKTYNKHLCFDCSQKAKDANEQHK